MCALVSCISYVVLGPPEDINFSNRVRQHHALDVIHNSTGPQPLYKRIIINYLHCTNHLLVNFTHSKLFTYYRNDYWYWSWNWSCLWSSSNNRDYCRFHHSVSTFLGTKKFTSKLVKGSINRN